MWGLQGLWSERKAEYVTIAMFYSTLATPGYNVQRNMVVEVVAGPEDWCRGCHAL